VSPRRLALNGAATALGALALAACSGEAPPPPAEETEVPQELAAPALAPEQMGTSIGTPLADRVATLGLINKRNNITREIEMKPGEARRIGDVVIRLASCERTAPWESPPLTGAFVQVSVLTREEVGEDPVWRRFFSGWLYKEAPAVNVMEHPIYDVWVKDCAMSFPGEDAPAPRASSSGAPARTAATPAPADPASPAPAASPAAEAPAPTN
jgi:hypothetical protein